MYSTVPTGSNPTGASSGPERKLEILKLAHEHDLLILEDDPYYFLASERPQSYFELETQVVPGGGRVIRFDSLSKVLSSGMRLVSPQEDRMGCVCVCRVCFVLM